jgi:hypothetical protein
METTEKEIIIKENKDLQKYISEFNKDVEVSIGNLREKSLMMSALRAKWLSYYMKEKENYQRIVTMKSEIIKSKADKSNSFVLKLKSEEAIANSDERVKKLNILQNKTKENLDYLERAMNILNDMVWQIKNTINILQLENS